MSRKKSGAVDPGGEAAVRGVMRVKIGDLGKRKQFADAGILVVTQRQRGGAQHALGIEGAERDRAAGKDCRDAVLKLGGGDRFLPDVDRIAAAIRRRDPVIPRRSKNRHSVPTPTGEPRSAMASCISASVISPRSATRARMKSA